MNEAMVSSLKTYGCSPKPYTSPKGTTPLPRAKGWEYEQENQAESGHYIYKSCVEDLDDEEHDRISIIISSTSTGHRSRYSSGSGLGSGTGTGVSRVLALDQTLTLARVLECRQAGDPA